MSAAIQPDWHVIEAVCTELYHESAELSARIVARIHTEIPGNYHEVLSDTELRSAVFRECRNLFGGLIERRPPSPAEADDGRLLGRLRAEQGLRLETVIGAYHVGYRMVWEELRVRLLAGDHEEQLLPVTSVFWSWLRSSVSAVADGYATAGDVREESRDALARTLIAGLAGGPPAGSAARGLGFDPDGWFQVICAPAADWPADRVRGLRRELGHRALRAAAHTHGAVLALVSQDARPEPALALLGDHPVAGVGLRRAGLGGAAESLTDAERALVLARARAGPVHFERDWVIATLVAQLPRLQPLITPGSGLSRAHLTESVAAFVGNRFSIAGAAAALHIHPNTLRYRLDRWERVTGWDVHTLDGLLRSALNIAMEPIAQPG
ncbi:PucR family transcriptional regulator [Actinoplanes sp. TBRC 11911]|uniref:PucR family transcriptional regulator n=1 Tax=Actinoplanes sp. TBRC 11911 TaxID=2729386 RepID=UPI00145E57DD|nr:helix-turn-helix domain-containing protein [Actinoplanes sp. TBRC 11911]NMO56669.1 PucR family transcriptional regulator [Actinoplanes sp. TBRC 11911]